MTSVPTGKQPEPTVGSGRPRKEMVSSKSGSVVVNEKVVANATFHDPSVLLEASALADRMPRADFFQFGHDFNELPDEHRGHALGTHGLDVFPYGSRGFHESYQPSSLHNRL